MKTEQSVRLPAEWEPQSALLLTWPHKQSDWKNSLAEIEQIYLEIIIATSACQKTIVICYDESHSYHILNLLQQASVLTHRFQLIVCPTNDTWCRDYGPLFTLVDGKPVLNNFSFNGWGEKYPFELDDSVNKTLYQQGLFTNTSLRNIDIVLEPGSIDTNGQETLLTTSSCLLKRYPDKSRHDMQKLFKQHLGCDRVLWLEHGRLTGDDTDGHIDNLARFVDTNTIVYCSCQDSAHPDYQSLRDMEAELKALTDDGALNFNLIPIAMPATRFDEQYLPASYINFLVINGAVLVPQFGVAEDITAMNTFKQCFPDRRVIGIISTALIKQYGGIHCATMPLPSGVINSEKA